MKFYNDKEDDNDFFDKEFIPEEEKPKAPKPPKFRPNDPRYWEGPESEWEHLRVSNKRRLYYWLIAAFVVMLTCIAFYMRYLRPYSTDGVQYGYIENIEKQGIIFKTFEGILLPYRELMDTTRIYQRDFLFSAKDTEVATEIKRLEMRHKPVRMEYIQYNATLPWRGDSKIIVTKVEEVDASQLLPPEFAPEFVPQGDYPDKTTAPNPDAPKPEN